MIFWKLGRPSGDTILARLKGPQLPRYAVLYYNAHNKCYYEESGKEIPYGVICQWESIESEHESKFKK